MRIEFYQKLLSGQDVNKKIITINQSSAHRAGIQKGSSIYNISIYIFFFDLTFLSALFSMYCFKNWLRENESDWKKSFLIIIFFAFQSFSKVVLVFTFSCAIFVWCCCKVPTRMEWIPLAKKTSLVWNVFSSSLFPFPGQKIIAKDCFRPARVWTVKKRKEKKNKK